MPISIGPAPDLTTVGPGLPISIRSDFIGPFPSDAQWQISLNLEPDFVKPFLFYSRPCTGNITSLTVLADDHWSETRQGWTPQNTRGLVLEARIRTATGVIDTGTTFNVPWDTTTGLGFQTRALAGQSSGQGGFTDQDRQQLQAIETRTQTIGEPEQLVVQTPSGLQTRTIGQMLSRPTLDLLTLQEATSGPTGDPVRFSIKEYYFGVIVRVTTIAPDLVPKTPDAEWYFNDLAVLRVFRGADLQFRRGIHTPTFMTEHPWEWGLPILNQTDILGIPPDITIAVDWRSGCEGQVFLQRFP